MPRTVLHTFILALLALSGAFGLSACSTKPEVPAAQAAVPALPPLYQVGAGDSLTIFVCRNAELTTTEEVRPDGGISVLMIEELYVEGKNISDLSRAIETEIACTLHDHLDPTRVGC